MNGAPLKATPDVATPMRRHILVGVDGSVSSIEALRWAAHVAEALELELDAVTTWTYPASFGVSGPPPIEWNPAVDAAQVLDAALTSAFGSRKPVGLRATVHEGEPGRALVDASANAEMLVVGSRGHGGLAGLLLGSVSSYCAEHAACPVVVTRGAHVRAGIAEPVAAVAG